MPPPQRTLAWHAPRKGRAAPDLREEIRRSPTRGAFHRRAAVMASMAAGADRGEQAPSSHAFHAFFTTGGLREGRSRRTRRLGLSDGEKWQAPCRPIARSAPDDFCVRVEVRTANQVRLREIQFVVRPIDEDALGIEQGAHRSVAQHGGLLDPR